MLAPFPWFGGKRAVAEMIWARLGTPTQYIEPFMGSAAVLLAAPRPASLEVAGDVNGFLANFWRCVVHQPHEVARHADYPVSHVDLHARHRWLLAQVPRLDAELRDPDWPGCAKAAGWWLYGQCAWIGSGWCEWPLDAAPNGVEAAAQIPFVGSPGMGVQAIGKIPHVGDGGRGVHAVGQIPHVTDAGRGVQATGRVTGPELGMVTSAGATALRWLRELAARLERVRIIHGAWDRTLNHHYGDADTAVFLDPPYRAFDHLYGTAPVADAVCAWARDNAHLRIALCGHIGDYPELDGWDAIPWKRPRLSYSGGETTDRECMWFSPPCLARRGQTSLFAAD